MSNPVTLETAAPRPPAAHPLLLPAVLLAVAFALALLVLLPNLPTDGPASPQQDEEPALASLPVSA